MKNAISLLLALNISLLPIHSSNIFQRLFQKKDQYNLNYVEILLDNTNTNYDIPNVSMKISNLPWKNHKDFLNAKEKYNTPFLLAGYCAVLKNPLPGESFNVDLASKLIKGEIINSGKIFSQNNILGPYSETQGFKKGASYIGGDIVMTTGGGVCKIATTLYNLAVLSNLEIIERHNHSMPINYVPYGQDATVLYGVKDLRFKNTTQGNILIWSQLIDNRLYIGFYGESKAPEIIWNHKIQNLREPSIKYIKNENLKIGEMNTLVNGLNGAWVESSITIKNRDGTVTNKEMGISEYIPLPGLIEIN